SAFIPKGSQPYQPEKDEGGGITPQFPVLPEYPPVHQRFSGRALTLRRLSVQYRPALFHPGSCQVNLSGYQSRGESCILHTSPLPRLPFQADFPFRIQEENRLRPPNTLPAGTQFLLYSAGRYPALELRVYAVCEFQ